MISPQLAETIDLHLESLKLERAVFEFSDNFTRSLSCDCGQYDSSAFFQEIFRIIQYFMHIAAGDAYDNYIKRWKSIHCIRCAAFDCNDILVAKLFCILLN